LEPQTEGTPVPLPARPRLPDAAPLEGAATAAELLAEPRAPVRRPAPPDPEPAEARPLREERRPRVFAGLLQIGSLAVLTYFCLFNFSVVRGSSMAPRIHDGDRILIDHFSYMFADVGRGDIVVLKYPLDPSVDYIKRVIGLPGDEVLLEDGEVWVNGEPIDEPYVDAPDPMTRMRVRVKPAHYFVLGDNRRRSCDSREFGLVPKDYVRGKVEVRVWPLARLGPIDAGD